LGSSGNTVLEWSAGWLALEFSPEDEAKRLGEVLETGCGFHFLDARFFLDPARLDNI
jgi:hypothetical protein